MKEYNIILSSKMMYMARLVMSLVISMALPGIIVRLFQFDFNFITYAIVSLGVFSLVMYLTQSFSKSKAKILMGHKGIELSNGKKWGQYGDRIYISWTSVKEYTFQQEQYFSVFKIILTDQKKIKIAHDISDSKHDDFDKFETDFIRFVDKYNKDASLEKHKITLGKSLYESNLGLILSYVIAIV